MDTFFLAHGSPVMSIGEDIPARHFLQSWRDNVMPSVVPKSILIVSGHWEASSPSVTSCHGNLDTIYDYYGFPPAMYKIKYPAPGAPDLAKKVKMLLENAGFGGVKEDKTRGLDHGAWVPLMLMYPEANIPVCQLSVIENKDGTYHYNMGKALAPLREEGVLIIGSGNATHNLRSTVRDDGPTPKWAIEFDTWLKDSLINGRHGDVNRYEEKAPYWKVAHPSSDHFFPLHVALGAAGEKAKAKLIHHSWTSRTISYASYRFSTTE